MKLKKALFTSLITLFLFNGTFAQSGSFKNEITSAFVNEQLNNAVKQYEYMAKILPPKLMPRSYTNNTLNTCSSANWIAGFYPGTLLYLYKGVGSKPMYDEALKRIVIMDSQQYNTGTHDLGFMMYCSYGNLYRITPQDSYKQILIHAARSLAKRFNPTVGCIRSWGKINDTTEFRVIIDNMMNLELLFWAARATGDKSLYDIAVSHANTTLKNHFRKDYSSYHVVVYNPLTGAVIKKQTAQGATDESAWARGQSWGLYGYTMIYRETKDKRYLTQAQNIAHFILTNSNLPKDRIPYWDYNAPDIPNAPRDASAAAVMASAFIELAGYSNKALSDKYLKTAGIILRTLATPEYTARIGDNGGFILKHSVAHFPKKVDVDSPLPYADYYYIEALLRYKALFKL